MVAQVRSHGFNSWPLSAFSYFHLIINTSCILFSSSQNGMTGLMHAAYKGNTEACNTLLENGADVNSNFQSDGVQHNLGLIPILSRLGNGTINTALDTCVCCVTIVCLSLPYSTHPSCLLQSQVIICLPSLSLPLFSHVAFLPSFLLSLLISSLKLLTACFFPSPN